MTRCSIIFLRAAPGVAPHETDTRHPGDRISVRIVQLAPFTRYTIRIARRVRDEPHEAFIEAEADGSGVIDTAVAVPLRGTYASADPDGLFWSMRRSHGSTVPIDPDGVVCSVERDGAVLATRTLRVERACPGVRVQELDDAHGLIGTLYHPIAPSARPALLTLGGSTGGVDGAADYAAALANQGFVALALAYFGAPGLPASLVNIPLEYFERAICFLQGHPAVAREQLAVVGRSRGGELALLLGSCFPEIAAVVAHVASPYRWCGAAGPASAAWTRRGAAMPYLAPTGDIDVEIADGRAVCTTAPLYRAALQHGDGGALSEIEATRGPVLLLSADDDQVWPSALFAERAMSRLSRRTDRSGDEWISYPDAGHGGTRLPGDPTTDAAMYHPRGQIWLAQGGTAHGNARAQRDAWDKVVGFLHRHLC